MENKVLDFYNTSASFYDKEQDEFSFVRVPEWEIAINTIRKVAGKSHSLLEIGAGTGRFTLEAAPLVKEVTAVDISPNMLEVMAVKAKERGITNIRQIHGDFMKIPFQQKFDIIISFSALEYINDSQALFSKISQILAPGGKLILTTAHDTFFRWWGRMGNYFRQGIFMEAYSKKKMEKLLNENGLKVVEMADMCLKSFFVKGILLFVYAEK